MRGGGGGGKQDDDEDNGKFVSFVPLPTQAEIESAILAKRKAELLQVSCCAARASLALFCDFSRAQRYASKELLESQAVTAAVAGSSKRGRE